MNYAHSSSYLALAVPLKVVTARTNRMIFTKPNQTQMMTEAVTAYRWRIWLRKAVPQVLTGSRVVFGAAAVITSLDGQFYLAAALITLGAVTDGFDGLLARRLNVSSAFGALFDCFTDYLCFVVAPWILMRGIVDLGGNIVQEAVIGLPLLTGAIRSAPNSLFIVAQSKEVHELPGLATVFFAFLPVTTLFLEARSLVGERQLTIVLTSFVVIFSLLMLSPVRYPKLTKFRGASAPLLVLLTLMPFLGTRVLAGVMLTLGLMYVALAHLLVRSKHK